MKKLKNLLGILLICATLITAMSCTTTEKSEMVSNRTPGEPFELVILGTSDMHGNVWGFSYEDSKESTNNGMSRLYTFIENERVAHPGLILLDAGDDIQGTIMTDDLANKNPDELHPVIAAMNYMGYDAMTLGNHEFNWGIPTMNKILSKAEFPVLAANVKNAKGKYVTGAGTTIINRDGVKVAVIGVVTPDVPIWDGGKEGIEDYVFESAAYAVKDEIAKLDKDVDISKDHNIEKLKRYVYVEYVWDKNGILEAKDSPIDKGLDAFREVYNNRLRLRQEKEVRNGHLHYVSLSHGRQFT